MVLFVTRPRLQSVHYDAATNALWEMKSYVDANQVAQPCSLPLVTLVTSASFIQTTV